MIQEGRTKKTVRNALYSFLFKGVDVILAFILRTIFIKTLGATYLGINGLFTNILTVLSLMELGVGGAIVFSLYEPLAKGDNAKTAALMQLYRKVYFVIGVVVSVVGVSLTPFLKYIINLPENIDDIYIIYWISVANTAVSYFLAYRRSLLIADQHLDINNKNQIIFKFTRFIILSVILVISGNFIIYLVFDVINTIASNLHITYIVKKRYADVENSIIEPLSDKEKKAIVKYMTSGIISKFGQTIVNSTDNIIISIFVGTIFVGLYSNYNLVVSNINIFVYLIFNGLTASIGNYAVTESSKNSLNLFKKITFLNYFLSFYFSICLFVLFNPLVSIWAGPKYLLSKLTVFVIVLNFYISSNQMGIESFLGADGKMFYHNRFRSLIEGIVNLLISVLLVKFTTLGITGVFLGTTVCFIFGRVWMDVYTLYKYWFKEKIKQYYISYISRILLMLLVLIVSDFLVFEFFKILNLNIFTLIICGVLISIFAIAVFIVIYRKCDEFKYFYELVISKTPLKRQK